MYVIGNIDNAELIERSRIKVKITGNAFVVGFVGILIFLSMLTGYSVDRESGFISAVEHKYLLNFLQLKWPVIMLLTGVVLVLSGMTMIFLRRDKNSFYVTGGGVVLAVWSLLIVAAFNNTAFFPSNVDAQYSLTLYNSSSSEFTLKTMAVVSVLIPFVLAYIVYAWREMTKKKISTEELEDPNSIKY